MTTIFFIQGAIFDNPSQKMKIKELTALSGRKINWLKIW